MSILSRVLFEGTDKTLEEPFEVFPRAVGRRARGCLIRTTRLRGGLSEEVDLIEVDNGAFSFSVIPTRGMGVWKARAGGMEIGWGSPVNGPVHPRHVPLDDPDGWGWLKGFDELLVRCGLESNGDPDFDPDTGRLRFPLHGRIANLPASRVEVSIDDVSGDITLTGVLQELRADSTKLRLTTSIATRFRQPGFTIRDEVENLSDRPVDFQLLYHVNFGPPLLGAGARLIAPAQIVVPRDALAAGGIDAWREFQGPKSPSESAVYLLKLEADRNGRNRVLLRDPLGERGASLAFSTRQLPCFTLWKKTAPLADGYVTALEPGTNYPNPRSFEAGQGRVATLKCGGHAVFNLDFEVHASRAETAAIEREITGIGGGRTTTLFRDPQAGWCPSVR